MLLVHGQMVLVVSWASPVSLITIKQYRSVLFIAVMPRLHVK